MQKAVLGISSSLMHIWWYPDHKSSLEKKQAPWSSSNNLSIIEMENLSFIVILLRDLKLTHSCHEPSSCHYYPYTTFVLILFDISCHSVSCLEGKISLSDFSYEGTNCSSDQMAGYNSTPFSAQKTSFHIFWIVILHISAKYGSFSNCFNLTQLPTFL